MCELLIDRKNQTDINQYLSVEHNILLAREYRKSFDYIEELINRKVKPN